LALSLAPSARSVAVADQPPAAHSSAPAAEAPHAAPAEAPHAAAPAIQDRAPAAQPAARPANSPQNSAPQTVTNTVRSNATDHRQGRENRGRNLNNGNYGYPGYAYYPFAPAYDYWNPYWNNYNNTNGPTYPGQFTQPDAAVSEPDESANQTLSAPTNPEVTPPPPSAPDTTSASLNSALIASPQWRDADAQVRLAQSEYDAASAIILAQLRTQPAYQQALAQKAADAQKLNSIEKKDPAPPMDRTESAATAKLTAAQTLTQMETAALAADPHASGAKAKLDAAVINRLEVRRQIEASVPKPPNAQ
jgi:CCR4-NOT transcriptional regulation complex NOT5 subunit